MSILFIAYGALYPFHFIWAPLNTNLFTLMMQGATNHYQRFDVIQNLLFYMPLGFFALLWAKHTFKRCTYCCLLGILIFSLAYSMSLESLQAFVPNRYPSLMDVGLNGISALLGVITAIIFGSLASQPHQFNIPLFKPHCWNKPLTWASILLMILWLAYHWYPYIPSLEPKHLQLNYAFLRNDFLALPALNFSLFSRYLAECIGIAFLMSIFIHRQTRAVIFVLAMLTIMLGKFLIITRVVSIEAVLAIACVTTALFLYERIREFARAESSAKTTYSSSS